MTRRVTWNLAVRRNQPWEARQGAVEAAGAARAEVRPGRCRSPGHMHRALWLEQRGPEGRHYRKMRDAGQEQALGGVRDANTGE